MIRRPPRSTLSSSSAASDVYKRQGFFYTTGSFKGSMTLGYKDVCNYGSCFKVPSAKLRSNGRTDMFLAKYGPRNQLIWAKKAGGNGKDVGEAVALSNVRYPDDNAHRDVYVTGTTQGQAWFDSTKTVNALSSQTKSIFVTKYNSTDGAVRWAKLAATCDTTDVHSDLGERLAWKDSYSHCRVRAIGVDDQGDVVITGKFYGTLNLDDGVRLVSGTTCRVRAGTGRACEHSVFMAKFSRADGGLMWADTLADPVHVKADPVHSSEFRLWANRTQMLFHTLDDNDDERLTDNWPLGSSGLNTNLYQTRNV
eukprot:TRINITY_DN748_c0_g1_i2.p2 TRINITY_DN748_c0_g1~~TRINITY_DN748_c0_g1_i2.p2  ORF type:complete len:309 (-),score=70.08 TRINITY_DN748_c0_g1_i2:378-1304(-)